LIFEAVAADDYSDLFSLAPIDKDTFDLALKQWAIWRQWEDAFHAGTVTQDSHPGFGGKNPAYDAYEEVLRERLAQLPRLQYLVRAAFRASLGGAQMPPGMMRPLEVSWQEVT
jgi:hypothetical protein